MEGLVNKEVLFDYFSGRVSPLQKKSIENWLNNAGNRELYYQWLNEWELSRLQTNLDWQPVYEKTAQRISDLSASERPSDNSGRNPVINKPLSWWNSRTSILAASIILALLLGSWIFRDTLLYQTIRTGFGETQRITLPDGSIVTLNANSSLRFVRFGFGEKAITPSSIHQNHRTVELTGEADFSVRHLPNHQPFVVITPKGLDITVLGTQFTVFSRERGTKVALRSGKVQLTTQQQKSQSLIMQPGDLATFNQQGKLALTHLAHPETMASWKDHRFVFEQTALRDIAAMLHDNYGLVVTIEHAQLASRTVSGSFTARNANELLQLIAQVLQINYIRDNNRVSFTD